MSLAKLKRVDNNIKSCIFGYTRETESSLSITVPMLIQYLIILYYWIEEKFTAHGSKINVDKTNKIAWYDDTAGKYNTVYGNYAIDINDTSIVRYKWTFKIISTYPIDDWPIVIGIDSSNNKFINNDFASNKINDSIYRAIGSNSYSYNHGFNDKPVDERNRIQFKSVVYDNWRNGDLVEMVFNVKTNRLDLKTPSQWLRFAKNIDFSDGRKYNLAVTMFRGVDQPLRKIQLVKFEAFQK